MLGSGELVGHSPSGDELGLEGVESYLNGVPVKLVAWDKHVTVVGQVMMGMMVEGLGLGLG